MDDYLLGKPLQNYFQHHEYSRLNVVERILLSQGDPKRQSALALDLENRLALQTPDLDQSRYWFGAAVTGGAFGNTYAGAKLEAATLALGDSKRKPSSRLRALGAEDMESEEIASNGRGVRFQKRGNMKKVEALADLRSKSDRSSFAHLSQPKSGLRITITTCEFRSTPTTLSARIVSGSISQSMGSSLALAPAILGKLQEILLR